MKTLPQQSTTTSLNSLITAIEQSHHVFTRDQIARVADCLNHVGDSVPEALQLCFRTLRDDLVPHLMKEERILFPYITALELDPAHPHTSCFGSIANPIRMMKFEHDAVKTLLTEMRQLTTDYQTTPDADPGLNELYSALKALDDDLVEHMHWEDDVLFPRALELESH